MREGEQPEWRSGISAENAIEEIKKLQKDGLSEDLTKDAEKADAGNYGSTYFPGGKTSGFQGKRNHVCLTVIESFYS